MAKSLNEQVLLGEIIDRLVVGYPDLDRGTIEDIVHDMHSRFSGAPLREFVPLFVERKARTALNELAVSYA